MPNKKIILILISLIISAQFGIRQSFAVSEKTLMPLMPRIGTDNKLEPAQVKTNSKSQDNLKNINDSNAIGSPDMEMRKLADEVRGELDEEEDGIISDLKVLWQSAVERSETIRFAILKLSNPDGDQDKSSAVKKILAPLASVAPLVGAGSGNAVAGSSAILGGGLLGSLLSDDSAINTQLSRVTDADLVILAKEIDDLQQKLVDLYYNYLGAVERLNFADKMVQNRYKYYELVQKSTVDSIAVADVFYREALDIQYKARQEVLSSRAALEQFVGNESLIEVDKNIRDRIQKSQA